MNENRFNLHDKFDKSSYLSTMPRLKALVPFETQKERQADLILKGGEADIFVERRSDTFYDQD